MPEVRSVTYCSFSIIGKSLGVVILEGELDPVQAAIKSRELGLNPGGQLLAMPCKETDPDIPEGGFNIMWDNRNRLIPEIEARILFDGASIEEHSGTVTPN
jgi:hypothetical protein